MIIAMNKFKNINITTMMKNKNIATAAFESPHPIG
jgi:hypothetical protein